MNAPVDFDPVEDAFSKPLDQIDVSDPKLYQDDIWYPYFARLRRDEPVHFCESSVLGPFWSVTKYKDIMRVETSHAAFSSASTFGGITLRDRPVELELPMFIAMDPPKHDEQRKVVQPIVAPGNLARLQETIRAGCEGWIRAEAAFEGVPDETVETPAFHGLAGDATLTPLAHRNDLRVRAFPVHHSVPSLGYTILAH